MYMCVLCCGAAQRCLRQLSHGAEPALGVHPTGGVSGFATRPVFVEQLLPSFQQALCGRPSEALPGSSVHTLASYFAWLCKVPRAVASLAAAGCARTNRSPCTLSSPLH